MTDFVRRLMYFCLGIAPTILLVLTWLWTGETYVVGSLLVLSGLMVAAVSRLPASTVVRAFVALLTVGGTVICWQSSATQQCLDGILNSIQQLRPGDISYALKTSWVLFGPCLCAAHFTLARGCTPNNSSKPTPLRGAA
jgi:hypothetical protein